MGIIGGSGLSDPDILLNKTVKSVDTPYGKVFTNLKDARISTAHVKCEALVQDIRRDRGSADAR